jgi:hypothetical protein
MGLIQQKMLSKHKRASRDRAKKRKRSVTTLKKKVKLKN